MGNPSSKPPQSLDTNVVHEGDFLQTYRGGNTNADKIDMGPGVPKMSIGAKIIQDTNGEFYVTTKQNKKLYLSSGGQFVPQAKYYIKNAKGYGEGPAIILGGNPAHPTYTVFSSTSTAPGSSYTPMTVNNMSDLRKAVLYGHENEPRGKYANMYGSASVNPFEDRPRNAFSTLADIGRGALTVVDMVAVPVLEYGLDMITDDVAGTLLQITGLDNALQSGLDSLTEVHGLDFNSTDTSANLSMSTWIHDPRLDDQLSALEQKSRAKVDRFPKNSYAKQLGNVLNSRANNEMDKVIRLQLLKAMNLNVDASQQMEILKKTVKILQKMVPNPPDADWGVINRGIEAASTPEDMIRLAQITTRNLKEKVLPFIPKPSVSAAPAPKSVAKTPEKPKKSDEDVPKPQSSAIINGQPKPTHDETRITAFAPAFVPAI